MATPQPSDATTSDGNPPAIRWRARRRQPPRPNARPRLDLFQSRTGPPHPCGGLLHLRSFYLLTRPTDKRRQFTFPTTLGAGLDQLVKSGSFACVRRPDVPFGERTNAWSPASEVPRFGQAQGHQLPRGGRLRRQGGPVGGAPSRHVGGVWQARAHARRRLPTHAGPRGQLVAVRRHQGRRDPRLVRRGSVDVLPPTRPADRRSRPRWSTPRCSCAAYVGSVRDGSDRGPEGVWPADRRSRRTGESPCVERDSRRPARPRRHGRPGRGRARGRVPEWS